MSLIEDKKKYLNGLIEKFKEGGFDSVGEVYDEIDEKYPYFLDCFKHSIILAQMKENEERVIKLINWGRSRRMDNTIYRLSSDEVNEDWIDKVKEVFE